MITGQMKRCSVTEQGLHSNLVIALQMLDALQQAIVQFVETGSMADSQLANIGETK